MNIINLVDKIHVKIEELCKTLKIDKLWLITNDAMQTWEWSYVIDGMMDDD